MFSREEKMGGTATPRASRFERAERRNYPAEVNEVSQVDEGKIAAKRGQCFLFSLSLFQGKLLRSRSILLEDGEQSKAGMRREG